MATRQRPWDVMGWAFDKPHGADRASERVPWEVKSVARLQQEAAVCLSLGGNFQIYETTNLRDGRLVNWRMERFGKVGDFFRERQELCIGSTAFPQVVVLNSEQHVYSQKVDNLFWAYDLDAIHGAVYGLSENSLSVELMDEWALKPVLERYPLVVAPEQDNMSDSMVTELKGYVENGGNLLLSGAAAYERFGEAFLGATSTGIEEDAVFYIRSGDGSTPVYSKVWRKLAPTTAEGLSAVGRTPLTNAEMTDFPPVVINKVGKGKVAYIPCDLFKAFELTRYQMIRVFIGAVVRALKPPIAINVVAPPKVDVTQRLKDNKVLVHLLNRQEGYISPANPDGNPTPAGPVVISAIMPNKPSAVQVLFVEGTTSYTVNDTEDGTGTVVRLVVPEVPVHCTAVLTF
mgnify:FL=1